jgi:hypothetical protein
LLQILFHGLTDFLVIDAFVLIETGIFGHAHRFLEECGNAVKSNPYLADPQDLAGSLSLSDALLD